MSREKAARVIPIQVAGHRQTASDDSPDFREPLPLSLYVHVPWCVQKCPYCDFNSHQIRDGLPEEAYIEALIADLESALPQVWGRRVNTVFLGGGTPSLLSGAALDTLLTAIRTRLPVSPDAEITLEANPGTVEAEKFAAFRAAGVNRLSLGIQSFNPAHLRALGRIHDDAEARRAIEIAARHFASFNLDLMYGLPGQTLAEAEADIETALVFAPPHLSCYQLTIEPNTAFAAAPPTLPEPDRCADMQDALEARLASEGYVHYETSAFARPGYECRHNLNYWTFGDYLGIGAGAHGKLTLPTGGGWEIRRQMRWKQPKQYLAQVAAGHPVQQEFAVPLDELPFEFMMNALRLNQGFDVSLFQARTGRPLHVVEPILRAAAADGMIVREASHLAPTERGRRFLNRLLERFLADPAA
ncbi:radical SAM family heme chaperone HemW [Propionivibrio soli]|uniref:radical SAM family heme chaperone HemW n=1 Tax=Propionivibrio soli TaxID=2976531 RepID=UPI0021E864F8|nr:radical SAM family heme chaperone HemW [Propionivibrio soli]